MKNASLFGSRMFKSTRTYGLNYGASDRVMRRSGVYGERAEAVLSMFRRLHLEDPKSVVNF